MQSQKKSSKKKISALSVSIIILSLAVLFAGGVFCEKKFLSYIKENSYSTKIGFTSDWEYRRNERIGAKLSGKAVEELEKAVAYMNDVFHPNFVVAGGDFIESSSVKAERAKQELSMMIDIFRKIQSPYFFALGNHDLRSLTKPEVLQILEVPEAHSSTDQGPFRIIVFDTNFNDDDDSDRGAKSYVEGYVSPKELEWLRNALSTDRPVIVFSHHSPIASLKKGRMTTNILNGKAVREILEEKSNVIAVISGHTPESYHAEVNGIHYFVSDTLVNELALGSFSTTNISYNDALKTAQIDFFQHGQDERHYLENWEKQDVSSSVHILRFIYSFISNK